MSHPTTKRRFEYIDLTQSDDEGPSRSQPRKVAKHPMPTPPSSSQPLSQIRSERDIWRDELDEHDAAAEIRLTEDFDDNVYENYELYGILETKIVGIRYYNGVATVGEYVLVKREPRNQYDRNAIRIDNVYGAQIGHIPRANAAKLAPLIVCDIVSRGSNFKIC